VADGEVGKEYRNYLTLIGIVKSLHGRTLVRHFSPKALKAIRQVMVERGWSRKYINRQIVRVRTIFKWGVSEGLVPVDVHTALSTLQGLRAGRCAASERPPVRAVTEAEMEAVLPHVSPVVTDMIRLQWYTGMRPGEVCIMRLVDIDASDRVWLYRPSRHKTQFRGRDRVIPLGPKAREIIEKKYFGKRSLDAFLFSPAESDDHRRAAQHARRNTPLSYGNRPGSNRRADPAKKPGDHYTTTSYGRAIAYGCEAAWPHPELSKLKRAALTDEQKEELRHWNTEHRWSPNQLRHAAATRIRRVAGLEMARAVLGHSTMAVTEAFYAEVDIAKVSKIMAKIG
jgi:integrase